jgi:hypothetical protein
MLREKYPDVVSYEKAMSDAGSSREEAPWSDLWSVNVRHAEGKKLDDVFESMRTASQGYNGAP